MDKRRCQIHAVSPITCFTVPIIGHTKLNLTTDEIYKCLCAKAEVTEILPSGKTVNLDFTNYDKVQPIKESTKETYTTVEVLNVEPTEESVTTDDKKESVEVNDKKPVEETEVISENNETKEEVKSELEESPVKTHELSSRNNNYKQNNYKNKNNKNQRKNKR